MLNSLLSIVQPSTGPELNITLSGYFNKIVSFWLIKKPSEMIKYLSENNNCVSNMVEHIFINHSIINIIIRICCVQVHDENDLKKLDCIRSSILTQLINKLDHHHDNQLMVSIIFEILTGILKKCYLMVNAKVFFEELLSPFILKPILDFTFNHCSGPNTLIGSEYVSLMLFNLFISEPHDAIQDVMEINFGFQVHQVAGVAVDQPEEAKEADDKDNKADGSTEFSAMQQEEKAKAALIEGKERIYPFPEQPLNPMVSSLLSLYVGTICKILGKEDIPTLLRVKLYELLRTIIQVNDKMLLAKLKASSIVSTILKDFSRFESNSTVLLVITNAVKSFITVGSDGHELLHKLLVEEQLLFNLASKL